MVIDMKEIVLISGNSFSTLVSRVDFNYIDGEFLICLIIHYAFDYKRLSVLDNFIDFRYIIKKSHYQDNIEHNGLVKFSY